MIKMTKSKLKELNQQKVKLRESVLHFDRIFYNK